MANEIEVNASLSVEDSEGTSQSLSIADLLVSLTTKRYVKYKMNVGTSEEALPLGDVSSLGFVIVINRDTTNFVELRVGTGGTKFAKMLAGEPALFRFGSGITAPYIIADTSACQVEVFLLSS